jgi:hypothetical protein
MHSSSLCTLYFYVHRTYLWPRGGGFKWEIQRLCWMHARRFSRQRQMQSGVPLAASPNLFLLQQAPSPGQARPSYQPALLELIPGWAMLGHAGPEKRTQCPLLRHGERGAARAPQAEVSPRTGWGGLAGESSQQDQQLAAAGHALQLQPLRLLLPLDGR